MPSGRAAMRRDLIREHRRARTGRGMAALLELRQHGFGGGLGVRPDVQVGDAQALVQPARVEVDLHRLRVRIEVAGLGRVVPQTRADADQQVARRRIPRARAGSRTRRRRRCRSGCDRRGPLAKSEVASSAPQRSASASSAGAAPERSTPRPARMIGRLRLGDHRRELVHEHRIGRRTLRRRHELGGRRILRAPGKRLLLQIHRHAQHHRARAPAARCRRLRARCRACGRRSSPAGSARRSRWRAAPSSSCWTYHAARGRRIAGEHDQRNAAARGGGERRHDLREAGAAGHARHAHLAGVAGIAVGHRAPRSARAARAPRARRTSAP